MAGDNGDTNSRSHTCQIDFHGFVLSLVFHLTPDNLGVLVVLEKDVLLASEKGKNSVGPLPESYTEIDPTKTLEGHETLTIPHLKVNHSIIPPAASSLDDCVKDILKWLDHAKEIVE